MRILFGIALLVLASPVFSQSSFGIGNGTPHPGAALDLSKGTRGFLVPRMTTAARSGIVNPAEGLLVYDTTNHRFFQYQDGLWRYFLNENFWLRATNTNKVFTFDSVGIGTASPTERLDVVGTVRSRSSLRVGNSVFAGGILQAQDISVSGNAVVNGNASVSGNITTQETVQINSSESIVQFKTDGDNRVFMQASGNDLRFGTNSGNSTGRVIFRMDGNDVLMLDEKANLRTLRGNSGGNVKIGYKIGRFGYPEDNMLAITQGVINADGTVNWHSATGEGTLEVTRISAGRYQLKFWSARVAFRAAFMVNPLGTAIRTVGAQFVQSGFYTLVEIYDPINRQYVDNAFSFMIQDPLNLFN